MGDCKATILKDENGKPYVVLNNATPEEQKAFEEICKRRGIQIKTKVVTKIAKGQQNERFRN